MEGGEKSAGIGSSEIVTFLALIKEEVRDGKNIGEISWCGMGQRYQ